MPCQGRSTWPKHTVTVCKLSGQPIVADYLAGWAALDWQRRSRQCLAGLLAARPDDNRWDYGIGVKNESEHVVWVEIHPASSNHVHEGIDKLNWLRSWLRSEAP